MRRLLTAFMTTTLFLAGCAISFVGVAPPASATETLDAYVAAHPTGSQVGDGQCIALVKDALVQVWGQSPGALGDASAYAAGGAGGNFLSGHGWTWSTDQNFQNGDILVWSYTKAGANAGHIAFWYNGRLYDQNDASPLHVNTAKFFNGNGNVYAGHWRFGNSGSGRMSGYETAFQANTSSLWTLGPGSPGAWTLGMLGGTSPAVTTLSDGGYEAAFQANTGSMWTVGSKGNKDWQLGMASGTSPSIAGLANGGFEVAVQTNTGDLWTVGDGGDVDWKLGMMPGTSPSITALTNGGYEVAFQANTGSLWTVGNDAHGDWQKGMMGGTSPSIAALTNGGYEVAFQANTGSLWTVGNDAHGDWKLGMQRGTSPAITGLANGGYEVAFQANTGSLWSMGNDGHGDWQKGMRNGTSPAIAGLSGGGYEIAFQANTGSLWTIGSDSHGDWQLGMANGTSPCVAGAYGGGCAPAHLPPQVTTQAPPRAVVGKPYRAQMTSAAGYGADRWSVNGGALPKGLSLDSDGVVHGTPRAAGTSDFTLGITDASNASGSRGLSMRVSRLAVTTKALPTARRGHSYRTKLRTNGAASTWKLIAGRLPRGLKLSRSGLLAGKPRTAGTTTLVVRVADRYGDTAARKLRLRTGR